MNKNEITVLIPVHKYNEEISKLLIKALDSVKTMNVLIIAPKEIISELKSITNVNILQNDGDIDFASQINLGAKNINTKYFSILEFDDVFIEFYFDNLQQFISDREFCDSDFVLPIVGLHKHDNDKVLSLANDASWVQGFSEKTGFLSDESTALHDIFIVSGGTFKTDSFNEIGGLKKDLKMYFSKELFLRAIYFGKTISVLPKIGYKHMVGRNDSLFSSYLVDGITKHEREFYNRKAVEEYKFKPNSEGSEIVYIPPTDELKKDE